MNITEFLGKQNRVVLILAGMALWGLVGIADALIDTHLEFFIFYLLPISFFSWFIGAQAAVTLSVMSAALTVVIDLLASNHRSTTPRWSVAVWLLTYLIMVTLIRELRSLYQREQRWSHTDDLTIIPNRRAFFEAARAENVRARRYRYPLTLAYIDVDKFKAINDQFGHAAGDKLLMATAAVLKTHVRASDMVARVGGDEFAMLLPHTDAQSTSIVLEKLDQKLNHEMNQNNWPVTFSIGTVTFDPPPESVDEMLSKADAEMYSKKAGKGRP